MSMWKWIGVVFLLLVASLLLLDQLISSPSSPSLTQAISAGQALASTTTLPLPPSASPARAPAAKVQPPPRPAAATGAPSGVVEKLDPNSRAFFRKIDDDIPDRFYTLAALRCYRPGAQHENDDEGITLNISVKIVAGEVMADKVTVIDNDLPDPAMSSCIEEAVKEGHWRDDSLPDWTEDEEVFIRPGGMRKHLPEEMDDDTD